MAEKESSEKEASTEEDHIDRVPSERSKSSKEPARQNRGKSRAKMNPQHDTQYHEYDGYYGGHYDGYYGGHYDEGYSYYYGQYSARDNGYGCHGNHNQYYKKQPRVQRGNRQKPPPVTVSKDYQSKKTKGVTNNNNIPTKPNPSKQTTPIDQATPRSNNTTSTPKSVVIIHRTPNSSTGGSKMKTKESARKREGKKVVPTVQGNVLAQELTAGTYECMVCCDKIRNRQEIWSCPCCYNLFHLKCISRWARSPAASVNEDNHEEGWRCPACQNSSTVIPSVYKCFCGCVINPNERRGKGDLTVPHSCGELCHKKLASSDKENCHHKCHQLCHPGPCPPCPVTVLRHCPCGKNSYRVRCSKYSTLPSCGELCERKLNCTYHVCQQICHEGSCDLCTIDVEVVCYCKRERKVFRCGEILNKVGGANRDGYSCQRMCNKSLTCGNHTCELRCHYGECPPCSLLPSIVTRCPCGATPINELLPEKMIRTSCLDDVPMCEKKCEKRLPCGTEDLIHTCSVKCHIGDCPPCLLMSEVVCKCGKSKMKTPCQNIKEQTDYNCNRVCRKPLSCGRHKCQTKCCVSEDHECRRVCGRKFSCGLHTCPDICHPRGCGMCWNISYEELTCHCGGEVLLPPVQCGSKPPECSRPCARPHPCDHPVTHACHNEEACPLCTFLTEKLCMGEHTIRKSIPCYLKDISCGMPCGRSLPCGMHLCRKTCHKGPCLKENESCKQPCTRERKYCPHPCSAPCHPDTPCPDTACNTKIKLKCGCGYRSEETLCLSSSTEVMSLAFQKLHQKDLGTMLRQLQSGQSVQINSISLENLKERRLDCNEECAQFERNRKLAEALELADTVDYSPTVGPQYSCYLLEQARENREFIESLESIFKQLVVDARQSSYQTSKHTFKPMKKNNRHSIHELAPYYSCTTLSYDSEPIRNVVVMATDKSSIPLILLSTHCNNVERSNNRIKLMPPPVSMNTRLNPEPHSNTESYSHTTPDYFNDDDI